MICAVCCAAWRVLEKRAPAELEFAELKFMMHKAQVKEVPGITCFSKVCPSDRLAISIFNTTLQD
eukprot:12934261-Prorocentrum_lima.AAC.1